MDPSLESASVARARPTDGINEYSDNIKAFLTYYSKVIFAQQAMLDTLALALDGANTAAQGELTCKAEYRSDGSDSFQGFFTTASRPNPRSSHTAGPTPTIVEEHEDDTTSTVGTKGKKKSVVLGHDTGADRRITKKPSRHY